MKDKAALVIAAIMITLMTVLSFSATTVSATHAQGTPTIAPSRVKANTSLVITITVKNDGPDPIENVRIIIPTAIVDATPYPGIAAVKKLKAGAHVYLGDNGGGGEFNDNDEIGAGSDNIVWIKAGTPVTLGATTFSVGKDNVAIVPKGTIIRWTALPSGTVYDNVNLAENLKIKLVNKFFYSTTNENWDNYIWATDSPYSAAYPVLVSGFGANNRVKLVSDTQAMLVPGTENVYTLPENTTVALLTNVKVAAINADNKFTLGKDNFVILDSENIITDSEDINGLRGYENFKAAQTLVIGANTIQIGDDIQIWDSAGITENLVFPAGTPVKLEANAIMYLSADTEVMRPAFENVVTMDNLATTTAENQPGGWTQSAANPTTTPPGSWLEWTTTTAENKIASGSSKSFPISIKTPNITTENTYTIWVRTKAAGETTYQEQTVTLTVDGAAPTYTVTALGGSYGVSPIWVKGNENVVITITANEPLAKVDNVRVCERDGTNANEAGDNVQVIMAPKEGSDNKIWEGTYTTGTSVIRDGLARIYVVGAQMEDLVGNKASDNFDVMFRVDRAAPLKPRLDLITGWPADAATTAKAGIQTKIATWTLENVIYDNVENTLDAQAGMTVRIRLGTTVYEVTTGADGYWTKQITLMEGTNELGIQIIDKAGNASPENAENITLDTTPPSISMISPVDGAIITDNTPTISLTITDDTLGVENADFDQSDNSGYRVILRRDDNSNIAVLTPKNPTTIPNYWNSLSFENDWVVDNLVDNYYRIVVVAGDNLQSENLFCRFKIDTKAPGWTDANIGGIATLYDPDNPTKVIPTTTKKNTWLIKGAALEAGSTINVYVDNVLKGTATASTTPNTSGTYDFSLSIELSEGKNQKIYFEEIDTGGLTSDKRLYGTYTVDMTPPVITLTKPADGETTDAAQITVEGTVTDKYISYDMLMVEIDCTGAAVLKSVVLKPDGSFSTTVPLVEGTNVINVYAKDAKDITELTGNQAVETLTVTRTVTPWTTYAIILVIIALILAAIAIFRKR